MTNLENLIKIINIPTNKLRSEHIQSVLCMAQKAYKHTCCKGEQNVVLWTEVSKLLWSHLETGLQKFDDQLLCATTFYTVLTQTEYNNYLEEILNCINNEIVARKNNNTVKSNQQYVISLIYGLYQSSFLLNNGTELLNINHILELSFTLITQMAYDYTRYSFIVFKILNSFKRIIGTKLEIVIFKEQNQLILLNLVNHNWENPITGIRDLNKGIFKMIISVMNDKMVSTITQEIDKFYWNKAKFLMLSEIIERYNKGIGDILNASNWVDGLIYSLEKQGLVSAGTDMYFVILKKLNSEDEWCDIFMNGITKVLKSSRKKQIENFCNYWCPATFKKYPSLLNKMVMKVETAVDSTIQLFCVLSIMKQGNKLRLIDKNWDFCDTAFLSYVTKGLQCCDFHVRKMAFEITCVSDEKNLAHKNQYKYVQDFVLDNVNSDCSVLRLGMLSSLKSFFLHLHISFLSISCNNTDQQNLFDFCKKMQEIIIYSLNLNGNYQRKITTVKICNTFIECLSKVPIKKKKQIRKTKSSLYIYLKENSFWMLSEKDFISKIMSLLKDPADDIRESVVQLLLNHYLVDLKLTETLNYLIQEAKERLNSKYFYQINCAQSVFQLIIHTLINENQLLETEFTTVEDVFYFAYNTLISEYKLNRNIVESIENGKQLHSFIHVLQTVFEICLQEHYKINISDEKLLELIDTLSSISNQFVWEDENTISSDFSKMNDMIQHIIDNSDYKYHTYDETKTSGLHQSVLNCLWLNVKASCELCSFLIKYTLNDEILINCLKIITNVLETSRHKGAIEAAGAALGQSILYLTSLPEENRAARMPYQLLTYKLDELISEASKMASVTRRGAGLSIMVHRIVSNDISKGKPLFHHFMKEILGMCTLEDIALELVDTPYNKEKDLRKAVFIHFLTRIVTDSSLASDVMFYSATLAKIAFDNLKSSHWQIRNAALQLYGALVPKLIGQKKNSGMNEETIASVAYDEFRTHSPKLWNFIQLQLKCDSFLDLVQYHSSLVPSLNILANCAQRYNFSHSDEEQKRAETELLLNLKSLLGSPIYTVRRLAAKSISNIFTLEDIYNNLIEQAFHTENILHGSLMLFQYCSVYYSHLNLYSDKIIEVTAMFEKIIEQNSHSYICKSIFEEVSQDVNPKINILSILTEIKSNYCAPGIFNWAFITIKKCIKACSCDHLPELVNQLLYEGHFDMYCNYILIKIDSEPTISNLTIQNLIHVMMSFERKLESSMIWKMLYELSVKYCILDYEDFSFIHDYLKNNKISYKLRYMIPFAARIYGNNEEHLLNLMNLILYLSNIEFTIDVDMRLIACVANNAIADKFEDLPDIIKMNAMKAALILLQDEDDDVRNFSVHFYSIICKLNIALQPFVCIKKILNYQFLSNMLKKGSIQIFCNDLCDMYLTDHNLEHLGNYNPFTNDAKNIYLEKGSLQEFIKNLNQEL